MTEEIIVANPLRAALDAGLTFPILVKIVGVNGNTAELLWESTEGPTHTLSSSLPLMYPFQWILTGANGQTVRVIQTAEGAQELHERLEQKCN